MYGRLPTDIDGFDSLAELALNMRWSWNHATDEVWRQLDPELWEITHNPWVVLQTVSRDQIERILADLVFRKQVGALVEKSRQVLSAPAWFQKNHPQPPLTCVAYFSMEYMLSEALPIYSGGLGNVAGDQLKAASDLGVPVVAVGLLYQQGYFRQVIDKNGEQEALFPYNDPGQLPITPLRKPNGEWLRLEIASAGLLGVAARVAGAGRKGETLPAGQQRRRELSGPSRESPASCMAAARNCASSKKYFWHRRMATAGCTWHQAGGLSPE
jgi:starch phosphorylase